MERKRNGNLDALLSISKLLEKAGQKLELHKIPSQESHELVYLINFARDHSSQIRGKRPDLAYIFDEAIPEVGRLLRAADFLIDGEAHTSIESRTRVYAPNDGSSAVSWTAIPEAQQAIQRAVGALRGAAYCLGVSSAAD